LNDAEIIQTNMDWISDLPEKYRGYFLENNPVYTKDSATEYYGYSTAVAIYNFDGYLLGVEYVSHSTVCYGFKIKFREYEEYSTTSYRVKND
jgi:hypothetical protein